MSATKKYLYVSSKVQRSDSANKDTFLDGLVWRIPLDQLDDGDRCTGGRATRTDFSGQAWTGDAAGFNPTLVQQDPSHTTMFWASHCFDDRDVDKNENQCNDKSQINITKVADDETESRSTSARSPSSRSPTAETAAVASRTAAIPAGG